MKTYKFTQGNLPILISMPHNGTEIPESIANTMTPSALKTIDTDWYLDQIYAFAKAKGCSVIEPFYSRYVIDLNRPEDNQTLYPGADTTELCPTTQFDSKPLYLSGNKPDLLEVEARIKTYWQAYHQKLKESLRVMRAEFGYALLFEAHSIKSVVPRFFEGKLADFNFGNNDQQSCSKALHQLINQWQPQGYSKVVNGRFKGGHITRFYAQPENNIDTLQLELSQATYLDENTLDYDNNKSTKVIAQIENLFENLIKHSLSLSK